MTSATADPSLSLEDLEGAWPAPPPEATYLMRSVHAARQVPLGRLTTEHLRVLIGQRESIHVLLPLAARRLVADPFAEGDYFPGDLLTVVMRLAADDWARHPVEAVAVRTTLRGLDPEHPDLVDNPQLATDVTAFLARPAPAG